MPKYRITPPLKDSFVKDMPHEEATNLPSDWDVVRIADDESILQEAERIINGDRKEQYGDVKESFVRIAEGWSSILGLLVTPKQVALMMIWMKISREVSGDKRDNWVDMAGYAGLGGML